MTDLARLELRIQSLEVAKAEKRLAKLGVTSKVVEGQTGKAAKQMGQMATTAKTLGFNVAGVVRSMLPLVGILGAIGAARAAVKTMAEFEFTMAQVRGVAIKTTETFAEQERQFASLEIQARKLGATTRYSATEAGKAQLFLARTGFDVNKVLAATPGVLDLASAGVLELGEAADIASNVLQQFRLEAEEMGRVGDVMVNTANSTNTSVRQLAEALSVAGPTAGALGLQLEEVSAAIGVMGDAGIQASLAGTQLRGIMSSLLGPTAKAEKTLAKLANRIGETEEAFDINNKTLREVFQAFSDAETSASDFLDVFSRRQAAGAIVLEAFVEKLDAVTESNLRAQGEAERLRLIMEDTLTGAFKNVTSAIEEVFIAVGDGGLLGGLKGLSKTVAETIRILASVEGAWESAGVAAKAFSVVLEALFYYSGLLVVSKLATWVWSLIPSFAAATGTVTAYTGGITAATAATRAFKLSLGPVLIALALAATAYSAMSFEKEKYIKIGKEEEDQTRKITAMLKQYKTAEEDLAVAKEKGNTEEQIEALKRMRVLLQDIQAQLKVNVSEGLFTPIDLKTLEDMGMKLDAAAIAKDLETKRKDILLKVPEFGGFGGTKRDSGNLQEIVKSSKEFEEAFKQAVTKAEIPAFSVAIGGLEEYLVKLGASFSHASTEQIKFKLAMSDALLTIDNAVNKYEVEQELIGKSEAARAEYLVGLKLEEKLSSDLGDARAGLIEQGKAVVRGYFEAKKAHEDSIAAQERDKALMEDRVEAMKSLANMLDTVRDNTAALSMEENDREKLVAQKRAELLLDEAGIANYGIMAAVRIGFIQLITDEVDKQQKLTEAKRKDIEATAANKAALQSAHDARLSMLRDQEAALESLKRVWKEFADVQYELTHTESDIRMKRVREEVEKLADDAGMSSKEITQMGDAAVEAESNLMKLEKVREVAYGIGQSFSTAFKDVIFGAKSAEEAARAFGEAVYTILLEKLVMEPLIEQFAAGITSAASDLFGIGGDTAAAAVETEAALLQSQAALQLNAAALTLGSSSVSLSASALLWNETAKELYAAALLLLAAKAGSIAGGGGGGGQSGFSAFDSTGGVWARGGVFSNGNPIKYARGGVLGFAGGGVVTDPYYFMAGNKLAVAGEGTKDEGIFPLMNDSSGRRSIQGRMSGESGSFPIQVGRMSNGDLGGVMGGATGGGSTTIVKKTTVNMHVHGVKDVSGFAKSEKAIIRRMKQGLS